MNTIPIFIGYDPREAIAFHTCVNSIIRHASQPVSIVPLALNVLKGYNETHADGSNEFIYSRFLVPYLMDYKGWAIFIDGDMIVRDDIVKLWNLQDSSKDLLVVKHDYNTKQTTKYLNNKNENYPCKNWSSVVLWNCSKHTILTPEFIQTSTGSYLHRFKWVNDNYIGELPIEWNWLPDEFGPNQNAKLLHYTLGTPCFHDFATTAMADEWHKERQLTEYCKQNENI